MKKKLLALVVMFALVLTSVVALVACEKEPEVKKYTVTYYDGTKELKKEEVEDGKTIDASYKPTKDGYTFVAWYDDITMSGESFDVKTPIKANTQLFAKFQSNTVENDNRIWYVMGNVNKDWDPVTALDEDGNWVINEGMDDYVLTQKEGTNEFSITLTMRAGGGSKFRFATQLEDKNWAGASRAQAGLGSIEGFALASGINPEDKNEYTLEGDNKWYGNVKNTDGEVVFEGGRQYDDPTYMWNIFVTEESEGIYEFTLKTFPGEDDRNVITWKRVGDAPVLEKTHDMFIAGTLGSNGNDFISTKEDAKYAMEQNADHANYWTVKISVTEADYASWAEEGTKAAIKVRNSVDGSWYAVNGDDNILLSEGEYLVVYNSEDNTVFVEELGYYIVGTMLDGTEEVNFSIKAGFNPELTVNENKATADLTVTDVTEKYSWLTNNNAIYAIKVVYGTSYSNKDIGILTWYNLKDGPADGNCYIAKAGEYTVTLDIEAKNFTIAEKAADAE